MLLPVIMAGGSGTRLWPLSRKSYPKQFLTLYGNQTMLQSTIERLETLEHHPPIIVCNEEHRFTVAEQLRNIDANSSGIILEPIAKSTAPSIALAAFEAIKNGDDPLLLVLPADHVIKDPQLFADAVNHAQPYAELGKLVTFGVIPSSAETGYGYIKKGAVFETDFNVNNKSEKHFSNSNLFEVARFVEKPDLETANQYLASQEYLWNSGIFLFKASEYLNELNRYQPDIFSVCQLAAQQAEKDADFIRVKKDIFATCPNDSIDYAVMEKTQNALVIPINCEWNDVGSWRFLWNILEKNEHQNAIRGDVIAHKTENCLVYAENKLVTTIGLNNVAIVETKDAILIADFSEVQNVKNIVDELKTQNRDELKQHREVIRPWGKFDALDIGNRFQVKRITVNPGEKLSLQMHHHRAEHWIVVTGTAKVINGDAEILVSENESTYIPIGAIHALENPGKVPLELIEVQSGSYLGEDDIVRLEDRYGRV